MIRVPHTDVSFVIKHPLDPVMALVHKPQKIPNKTLTRAYISGP